MNILLFGKNGQVGWELQRALAPLGQVTALDRHNGGDLADLGAIEAAIQQHQPAFIVNAAAHTAVDRAESEPEQADLLNHRAVAVMAQQARLTDSWLLHYSTDYVYAGDKDGIYTESDPVAPQNVYGRTKLAGEQAIQASGCRHLILRTSWVYAARGNNFAKTMLRLARERDSLSVVSDQVGAPTSAELIADVTALMVQRLATDVRLAEQASGIYHLVAGGETSWYDYARWVIAQAIEGGVQGIKVTPDQFQPIPSSAYPVPARRPANSRLSTSKIERMFGLHMPHWQVHAARLITELSEQ